MGTVASKSTDVMPAGSNDSLPAALPDKMPMTPPDRAGETAREPSSPWPNAGAETDHVIDLIGDSAAVPDAASAGPDAVADAVPDGAPDDVANVASKVLGIVPDVLDLDPPADADVVDLLSSQEPLDLDAAKVSESIALQTAKRAAGDMTHLVPHHAQNKRRKKKKTFKRPSSALTCAGSPSDKPEKPPNGPSLEQSEADSNVSIFLKHFQHLKGDGPKPSESVHVQTDSKLSRLILKKGKKQVLQIVYDETNKDERTDLLKALRELCLRGFTDKQLKSLKTAYLNGEMGK